MAAIEVALSDLLTLAGSDSRQHATSADEPRVANKGSILPQIAGTSNRVRLWVVKEKVSGGVREMKCTSALGAEHPLKPEVSRRDTS